MVTLQDEGRAATSPGNENEARAIEEANTELRRLSDYRSLMLVDIAHELRTPLTAILGFAEILLEFEKLTDSQKEFCEKIQNSGRQLQSTINLLSDLTRLDLDAGEISVREFSLCAVLRESCSAVSRQAEKKNVVLCYNAEDELSRIVSDESKLRQSLYNLLAYAIARSPVGGRVSVTTTTNLAGEFVVKIDDEGGPVDGGRGFDLLRVRSASENPSLPELGLDISRRLLEALGGTVALGNREPRGLSIALKLPAGTSAK